MESQPALRSLMSLVELVEIAFYGGNPRFENVCAEIASRSKVVSHRRASCGFIADERGGNGEVYGRPRLSSQPTFLWFVRGSRFDP